MARPPYSEGIPFAEAAPRPPEDYEHIEANPAEFGGLAAEGTERAGAGALALDKFYSQTAATQAVSNWQDKASDLLAKFRQLRGQDAMSAQPEVLQSLKEAEDEGRSSLPNGVAQLQFNENIRYLRSRYEGMVGEHYDQQAQTWAIAVNESAGNNALRDIDQASVKGDLPTIAAGVQRLTDARMKAAQVQFGTLTPDMRQNVAAKAASDAVTTQVRAIMPADPMRAQRVLAANATRLPAAAYDSLSRELKGLTANAQGDADLGAVLPGGGAPTQPAPQSGPALARPISASPGDIAAALRSTEASGPAAISAAGARGEYQVAPAFFRDYARPGENFDSETDRQAVAQRGIANLWQRYQGDPSRVAVAYFSGTGNVTPAGSPTPWKANLSDATGTTTSAYVGRFLTKLGGASAQSPNMPDWSAVEQRAITMTAGDDERQRVLLSKIGQLRSRMELATASERAQLTHAQGDLEKAALAGLPISIPESRYRAVFTPEEADERLTDLSVAQTAGQILAGIKFGSPAQVQSVLTDLTAGMGRVSDQLRSRLAGERGAPTVTTAAGPGQSAPVIESPEAFGLRTGVAALALQQIQERAKALSTDPAAYVLTEPTVAAAAHGMTAGAPDDPTDPTAGDKGYAAFARTALAVEGHLGVTPGAQHVLSVGQAQSIASSLTAPDVDVKQQLDALKKQWGDEVWPHVFGDLVTLGKLPPAYQSVAVLDDPRDAALLARSINETSKSGKDWAHILGNAGGKPVAQGIKDSVRNDPTVLQLERSLSGSGATAQQIDGIVSSIETRAYGKRFYNQDANAAQDAVTAFTSKYALLPNGDARVPVGRFSDVTANARATLVSLTPAQIEVPSMFRVSDTQEALRQNSTAPSAADYVRSIQANPSWITAPRGDALWLMDNEGRIVRGLNGSPIAVPFAAGPPAPPTVPTQAGVPQPGVAISP